MPSILELSGRWESFIQSLSDRTNLCLLSHLMVSKGSDGKESACSSWDLGSIPGSGRSPGEGNGNPLHYSCLGNCMDRGAWRATVRGVAKSLTRDPATNTHFHPSHWEAVRSQWRCLVNVLVCRLHGVEYQLLTFSEGPHPVTLSGSRMEATSPLKPFLSSPASRCQHSFCVPPLHVSWSSLIFKERLLRRAGICILSFLLVCLQKKAPISNCPHGPPECVTLAHSKCSTNLWLE